MRPEQFDKFKTLLKSRLERYFYPVIESYSSNKREEINFELIRRMDRQEEVASQIRAFLDDQNRLDDFREYMLQLLEEIELAVDYEEFSRSEKIVFINNEKIKKQVEIKFFINDCRLVVKIIPT